jgi:hypothetical protein
MVPRHCSFQLPTPFQTADRNSNDRLRQLVAGEQEASMNFARLRYFGHTGSAAAVILPKPFAISTMFGNKVTRMSIITH